MSMHESEYSLTLSRLASAINAQLSPVVLVGNQINSEWLDYYSYCLAAAGRFSFLGRDGSSLIAAGRGGVRDSERMLNAESV